MLIFDAHLDLSMNALDWNRDYTRPLLEIRECELGKTDRPDRGQGTVCFQEMRKNSIGICMATLISPDVKSGNPLRGWHSPEQAWAQVQGQLACHWTCELWTGNIRAERQRNRRSRIEGERITQGDGRPENHSRRFPSL